MKTFARKFLSVTLAAMMLLSMLPTVAFAADTTDFRIVHLDCGRKYFSVENIEKLIDTMAEYGYNQLQLAFGNGGCRFLLEDMSLSFGDVTMTSDTVKENITAGNKAFNSDESYLTQSEMTAIIAYAKTKSIEIVPMLNMPGHASAIVHNTSYTDNGNLNVANETAREYGYALLSKYVAYFKEQGCKYFHFGADESGYTGADMSTFLQGCVGVITGADMTPRMFNDPADSYGDTTIPEGVQITYWYINGNKSASALANAGYDMINTHGRWYYVIKGDQGTSEEGTKYWNGNLNGTAVSVELPVMKAEKMDNYWVGINEFFDANPGSGSIISGSLGSMFCIWCDASEDDYLSNDQVISTNENYGALYQLQKMAEHYWPEDINTGTSSVTMTDSTGSTVGTTQSASLTTGDSTTFTVSGLSDDQTIVLTSSKEDVATASFANNVITVTAKAAGTATITGTVASTAGVATLALGDELTINVTVTDGQTTEPTEPTTQTVNLEVGEEKTFDTTGTAGDYATGSQYIATATVEAGEPTAASVNAVTSITSGKRYLITMNGSYVVTNTVANSTAWPNASGLEIKAQTISSTNVDTLADYAWTITESGSGYTVVDTNGKYLSIDGNNSVTLSDSATVLTVTPYTDSGTFAFANSSSVYLDNFGDTGHAYFNTFASAWETNSPKGNNKWTLYEITEESSGANELTITGTGEGTTTVTIGGVEYTINVTAPESTETKVLNYGGTLSLPTGAEDVAVSGDAVSYADGTITAGTADGEATVTFVTKNVGGYVTARYTYNITVASVNLTDIDPLEVELWVTNTPIGKDENSNTEHWNGLDISLSYTTTVCTPATMTISAADAYGEEGVLLSDFVLTEGVSYDKDGSYKEGYTYVFWKGVALHDGTKQYHANSAAGIDKSDQSGNGTNFQKIRYWVDGWEYYDYDTNTWVGKEDGDNFVAYYLQRFVISPELDTTTRDWGGIAGQDGGTWGEDATWFDGFTGVASAVVYPDYSMSPADEKAIYDSSLFLIAVGEGNPAQPGVIVISEPTDYEIVKITIVQGEHADANGNASSAKLWQNDDTVNWAKETTEAGTAWYDETVIWTPSIGYAGGNITLDSTVWNQYPDACTLEEGMNHAFLMLIYIEPVEKEDNLSVVWWDDNAGVEIMSSQIVVSEGTTYTNALMNNNAVIGGKSDWSSNDPTSADYLPDTAYVTNTSGVNRTFNKDITVVSTLLAKYRTGLYEYIRAEISTDGKTLTLHYDIDVAELAPLYVIDFGLPATFGLDEVVKNYDDVVSVKIGAGTYGTLTWNADRTFTYTPTSVLANTEVINLTIGLDDTSEIKKSLGFTPASNVLYEEGFMKPDDSGEYQSWIGGGYTTDSNKAQSVENTAEYGYDASYEDSVGISGTAWTATVSSGEKSDGTIDSASRMTKDLTVSFYGNGFDLIGTCAPNSGYIFMSVIGQNSGIKKGFVIDASHSQKILYQVPLAHLGANDLTELDTYDVTIFGSYRGGADLTEFKNTVSSVKVIGVKDKGDGTTETVSKIVPVENLDGYLKELESSKLASAYIGNTIQIDGFRVYGDTTNVLYKDAGAYVETDEETVYKEYGLAYSRALDMLGDGFVGYIDGSNNVEEYTVANYEKSGGPQNEIYLEKNQHVALAVASGSTVQISLRGVEGATTAKIAGAETEYVPISHSTEMYYTVTASDDGLITISNVNTDSDQGTGMLAVCNIKCMPTTYRLLRTADYGAVFMLLASEPVFTPEKMEVEAGTLTVLRKQVTTLTVTTSTDVKYLEVNGKKVKPSNSWMVKRGVMDEYVFVVTKTSNRNTEVSFDIVAYDEDGLASEVYSVIA